VTPATTTLRATAALTTGVLALGMLAACTPQPEPTPTKTALFTSDEEAFKAAEETYRAYIEASNKVDFSDPKTFEAVYAWNTGSALSAEKEALTLYDAENLTRVGDGAFDSFEPLTASDDRITARLCLDVSRVDLIREDGASALPADRAPRAGREVTFTPGDTSTGLQISSNKFPDEDFQC